MEVSSSSSRQLEEVTKNLAVYVRVRPMNEKEDQTSGKVVDTLEKSVIVTTEGSEKVFKFDRVFSEYDNQNTVFDYVVVPIIHELLLGFNCTIFCYGSTGSGKTYTILGKKLNEENDPEHGLVVRAYKYLIHKLQSEREYCVKLSCIEIYNEEVYDLLSENNNLQKLKLYNSGDSTTIHGLTEVKIESTLQFMDVLRRLELRRRSSLTLLNANSSRSHSIFTFTVTISDITMDNQVLNRISKLKLVDLAGSEDIAKSGVKEKGITEAASINRSLLALGIIINKLSKKNRRNSFISFRDSKLTRLLEDSLGGTTQTAMIANISPSKISIEEIKNTLYYAEKAKTVICKPKKHLKLYQSNIEDYKKEIAVLKKRLLANEKKEGVYLPHEEFCQEQEMLKNLRSDTIRLKNELHLLQSENIELKHQNEEYRTKNILMKNETHEYMKTIENFHKLYEEKMSEMRSICTNYSKVETIHANIISEIESTYEDKHKSLLNSFNEYRRKLGIMFEELKVQLEKASKNVAGFSEEITHLEELSIRNCSKEKHAILSIINQRLDREKVKNSSNQTSEYTAEIKNAVYNLITQNQQSNEEAENIKKNQLELFRKIETVERVIEDIKMHVHEENKTLENMKLSQKTVAEQTSKLVEKVLLQASRDLEKREAHNLEAIVSTLNTSDYSKRSDGYDTLQNLKCNFKELSDFMNTVTNSIEQNIKSINAKPVTVIGLGENKLIRGVLQEVVDNYGKIDNTLNSIAKPSGMTPDITKLKKKYKEQMQS